MIATSAVVERACGKRTVVTVVERGMWEKDSCYSVVARTAVLSNQINLRCVALIKNARLSQLPVCTTLCLYILFLERHSNPMLYVSTHCIHVMKLARKFNAQ